MGRTGLKTEVLPPIDKLPQPPSRATDQIRESQRRCRTLLALRADSRRARGRPRCEQTECVRTCDSTKAQPPCSARAVTSPGRQPSTCDAAKIQTPCSGRAVTSPGPQAGAEPPCSIWWLRGPPLTKPQLITVLRTASTKKERDYAVEQLRQIEPSPRHELDEEGLAEMMHPREHQQRFAFVCWRCDNVYETFYTSVWHTSHGPKEICHRCHKSLCEQEEAAKRAENPFRVC